MINFLTLKDKSFGLDFSDLSLKIACLKKRGRFFKLASWGETRLEPGIIDKGDIKDEEKLAKAIKEGVKNIKGSKIKTKNIVASLPEKRAFFETIIMPKMSKEELKSAVPFEAENYIPLPMSEAYFDFQTIPSLDKKESDYSEVLVGAVSKEIVDPYVSCIKKAGFLPEALEIESQAISRALIKNEFIPVSILIIDFGRSRTSFIMLSKGSISFTCSIPISSDMLTLSISDSLQTGKTESEKLKIKYGLNSATGKKLSQKEENLRKKIKEAMHPILDDLAKQAKKYISYHESSSKNNPKRKVEKVLLSGMASNLKGFTDFLSLKLKIPVELGNPWVNILPDTLKEVPNLSFSDSLGYTTALGLALRCVKDKTA